MQNDSFSSRIHAIQNNPFYNRLKYIIYIVLGIYIGLHIYDFNAMETLVKLIACVGVGIIFLNPKVWLSIIAAAAAVPLSIKINVAVVSLVDIILILTLIPWLIKSISHHNPIKLPSVLFMNSLFLIVIILSLIGEVNLKIAIKEIVQYGIFAYLYPIFLFNSIDSQKQIEETLSILTIGTALLGITVASLSLVFGNATGFFLGFHKNALGGLMALPMPYIIMKALTEPKKRWQLSFLANGIGLLLSFSRGAWVGVFCGMSLVIFLLQKKHLFKFIIPLTLISILAFYTVSSHKENILSNHTMNIRQIYWGMALKGFSDKPWLGYGYSNFKSISEKYAPSPMYLTDDPHNVCLRMLAEIGVIGFAAFLLLIGYFFFKAFSALKRIKNENKKLIITGLIGGVLAYCIHGQFDVFWVRGTGTLFWIFISLLFVLLEKPLDEKAGNTP